MTIYFFPRNLSSVVLLLTVLSVANASLWSRNEGNGDDAKAVNANVDEPVEYGVDISFPMHYASVSTNYPWLPHNKDHSKRVPKEYEGMPIQPLGDRSKFYNDYIQGCIDAFGAKGTRCKQNEMDRIAMSLRQPQSMQNYVRRPADWRCRFVL
jgi:hypothetical protein